jgi:hypothetical protein
MVGHSVFGLKTMFLTRENSPGADAAAAVQAFAAAGEAPPA